MATKREIYGKLFLSMLYLSTFTFGGGYVIIPLMKKKFVDELCWLEEEEMLNLAAIAQSTPGAVAVNAAIIVGSRLAGIPGALIAVLGTVLPPIVILTIISQFYTAFKENRVVAMVLKAMMAGVAAVIIDVVITMGSKIAKQKKWLPMIILILSFVAHFFFKINVVYIIVCCAVIGGILGIRQGKGGKELL